MLLQTLVFLLQPPKPVPVVPHASASRQRPRPSSGDEAVIIPEEGSLHIKRRKVFDKNEGEYVDFEEV